MRRQIHASLLDPSVDSSNVDESFVRRLVNNSAPLLGAAQVDRLVAEILSDVHGLGALDEFLADDSVTDVMAVGGRGLWIERNGKLTDTRIAVQESEIERLIERIVAPLGLRVDRSSPMVDARLPDGSRVNAVVAPLAVDGPCLTIRKFGARAIGMSEIVDDSVGELLATAVRTRRNILISGGTGAGKTTLLNALASVIDTNERIVTVEDAAELRLPLRHVVRLESRPANSEGMGQVTLRDLVRNALRMRPDRIIVGEVRGGEAIDMLQAMNTGHEGSMSTCHANSPLDALRRIETMVLMSGVNLPLEAVRQQVVAAIDLVIQIARLSNGQRRVVEVAEVINTHEGPSTRVIATSEGVVADLQRLARRGEESK